MVRTHAHIVSKFLQKEKPDLYGQLHPIENEKLIIDSLNLLEQELQKLPKSDKVGYYEAVQKCPSVVFSIKHRLMFLRCEQFNCDKAAIRMTKYWAMRVQIFGKSAFDEKLTLEGALRHDRHELEIGFIRQLPGTDNVGRAIAFVQPRALEGMTYSCDGMVRAMWYLIHEILEESEAVQKKGIIWIVDLKGSKMQHFDMKMVRANTTSIKGILPLRVSAIHFCQPPKMFDILSGTVHFLLGEYLKKRIINHGRFFHEEDDVKGLGKYGIPSSVIPTYLGGNAKLNHHLWLKSKERSKVLNPSCSEFDCETDTSERDVVGKSLMRGKWVYSTSI